MLLSNVSATLNRDQVARNEDSSSASGEGSDEDEKGYAEKIDQPGTKLDTKRRITVRNLRIREDTAKYLRNLGASTCARARARFSFSFSFLFFEL
jgi:hypothetical protein